MAPDETRNAALTGPAALVPQEPERLADDLANDGALVLADAETHLGALLLADADTHLGALVLADADTHLPVPDGAHLPERRCILTGAHGSRDQLVRLALGPDGAVWPDLAARLPGRGAWIVADRAQLEAAMAKGKLRGALARAFKDSPPTVPDDLAERIAHGLERRALDRLGLEHRAGHLVFGSDRISETARAGRLALLLHAADAADDGCSKLNQAFRAGDGAMEDVFTVPAGRDALSAALGRENIVHSGVTDGRAAARVKNDLARWIAYLGTQAEQQSGGQLARARNNEGRA